MPLNVNMGWWAVFTIGVVLGLNPAPVRAYEPPTFDNKNGTEQFAGNEIKRVDGNGTLTLIGKGQDLTITEKKDGPGTLVLSNFGKITIKEKNGQGGLVIDENNKGPVFIEKINGPGNTAIRTLGRKEIIDKDGPGNVSYRGEKPIVKKWAGSGELRPE
jgi:hypothetical protein